MKDRYDVIIVGSQLGGLMTGAILAKYGFDVLWLHLEEDAPAFPQKDYTFYLTNPAISGFGEGEILSFVLHELGLADDEKRRFFKPNPPLQIITPRYRFELPDARPNFLDALSPLFPASERTKFEPFYEKIDRLQGFTNKLLMSGALIPSESFSERLRFDRESRAIATKSGIDTADYGSFDDLILYSHFQPESIRFFESQLTTFGHRLPKETSAYTASVLLSLPFRGFYNIHGGELQYLRHLLEGRITALKGDIIREGGLNQIQEIAFSKKDVELICEQRTVKSRLLLWNTGIINLFRFLPEKFKRSSFGEKIMQLKPALLRFTLEIGMKIQGFPIGMWHRILLFTSPTELDPALEHLYITINPVFKGNAVRNDKMIISVSGFLPLIEGKTTPAELSVKLKAVSQSILKILKDLIPFWDDFVEEESSEVSCKFFSEAPQKGHNTVFSAPTIGRFGLSVFANRTPMNSLLLTGPEVFPGLGFEGEILSAWNTTRFAVDIIRG